MLVSLLEYAKLHGKERSSVLRMIQRGGFKTAQKIGSAWVLDDKEPYPDRRVKSGKYRDWRKSRK